MNEILDRLNPLRAPTGFANHASIWRAVLLVVGSAVLGLPADLKNTAKFGQIDPRSRVVGARVMMHGQNPHA